MYFESRNRKRSPSGSPFKGPEKRVRYSHEDVLSELLSGGKFFKDVDDFLDRFSSGFSLVRERGKDNVIQYIFILLFKGDLWRRISENLVLDLIKKFDSLNCKNPIYIATLLHKIGLLITKNKVARDSKNIKNLGAWVLSLLGQLDDLRGIAKPQAIANALWATGKLAENGFLSSLSREDVFQLSTVVVSLLGQLYGLCETANPQDIANALWAMGKMSEDRFLSSLSSENVSQLSTVVVNLLGRLYDLCETANPQNIANALLAIGKLKENGYLWKKDASQLNCLVVSLLRRLYLLCEKARTAKPQDIANALLAIGKMAKNKFLSSPSGKNVFQLSTVVVSLLGQLYGLCGTANPQNIANALWAVGKMAENELLSGEENVSRLSTVVLSLLGQLNDLGKEANPQDIANALWAIGKMAENEFLSGEEDVSRLSTVVVNLLRRLYGLCKTARTAKPQEIANALWATGRLVKMGFIEKSRLKELSFFIQSIGAKGLTSVTDKIQFLWTLSTVLFIQDGVLSSKEATKSMWKNIMKKVEKGARVNIKDIQQIIETGELLVYLGVLDKEKNEKQLSEFKAKFSKPKSSETHLACSKKLKEEFSGKGYVIKDEVMIYGNFFDIGMFKDGKLVLVIEINGVDHESKNDYFKKVIAEKKGIKLITVVVAGGREKEAEEDLIKKVEEELKNSRETETLEGPSSPYGFFFA